MNSLLKPSYQTIKDVGNDFGCGEGWIWGNGDGDGDNGSSGDGYGEGDVGNDGDGIGDGDYNDSGASKHPTTLGLITEHHTDVRTSVALTLLSTLLRTTACRRSTRRCETS